MQEQQPKCPGDRFQCISAAGCPPAFTLPGYVCSDHLTCCLIKVDFEILFGFILFICSFSEVRLCLDVYTAANHFKRNNNDTKHLMTGPEGNS